MANDLKKQISIWIFYLLTSAIIVAPILHSSALSVISFQKTAFVLGFVLIPLIGFIHKFSWKKRYPYALILLLSFFFVLTSEVATLFSVIVLFPYVRVREDISTVDYVIGVPFYILFTYLYTTLIRGVF